MIRLRHRLTTSLAALPLAALAACNSITVGSVPTTGALYLPGVSTTTAAHICTASVVSSPTRDLIITAAHCIFGAGTGMTFVPGSVDGSAPYGRWTVTAAFVDPAWKARQDPLRDVAILRVAPHFANGSLRHIQEFTGGNRLIATPLAVGKVVVPAYVYGVGGSPIACLATAYRTGRYSTFDCGGYALGASGAPWIQGSTVLGVIGGLHQGGCLPTTSYSSPFDATTLATYQRAVSHAGTDVVPVPGSDGC